MTNSQKYKTADERARAFSAHCENTNCEECGVRDKSNGELGCVLGWLDLEAEEEEKPLPCPFCGGEVKFKHMGSGYSYVCECGYCATFSEFKSEAIAAHNRVARAALAEASGEVVC